MRLQKIGDYPNVPGKKVYRFLLLIPLITASLHLRAQQPVSQVTQFSYSQLSTTNVPGPNQQPFVSVAYQGLSNDNETLGAPSLPVKYIQLIVPRNTSYTNIMVNMGNFVNVPLNAQVYPAQARIPTADKTSDPPFTPPNPVYYQSKEPFPSSLVRYVRDGYFDGDKHIVTVAVYPVQYMSSTNSLRFYPNISFTISNNPQAEINISSITRVPIDQQALYNNALYQLVSNTADIPAFSGGGVPLGSGTGGLPAYEYLVVTSHKLRPAFEELVGWKRQKGLNAGIVEIDDILGNPAFSGGDLTSGIDDNAGRLRAYLKAAYGNGTMYVVLGGDPSVVPVRYAAGFTNTYDFDGPNGAHIPSDLYFSDFNGNWNVDHDIYYGEDGEDHVDYNPEIFVGRMMVRTEQEAVNHIHKVIRYERNPGRGSNDYLARAFMTQSDQLQQGGEAQYVAAHMPFYASSNVKIWEEYPSASDPAPTWPLAGDVITEMENYDGFVSIFGHGNPWSIGISTGGINGCPKSRIATLDNADSYFLCPPPGGMPKNGIDNLDDFDHRQTPYHYFPYLFYSVACLSIPYDTELDPYNGGPPSDIHFGDQMVNLSKAGPAAYIGNSRDGWVYTSSRLQGAFMDQVTSGNSRLGVAHALSKAAFYDTWCNKTNSLVGCPETDMWTAKPTAFTGASVSGSSSSITVNTGGVSNATIAIMSALDNGASYMQRTTTSATSYTFTGVPANYTVCITKHNYVPFIYGNSTLIQNKDISSPAYVASTGSISAGQSVGSSGATGPVTVKNGANVYFHADNNGIILLDKGFTVEQGAAFEAK